MYFNYSNFNFLKKALFILLVLFSLAGYSTHNRSGEITYKRVAPYTKVASSGNIVQAYHYEITVTIYTDDDTPLASQPHADEVLDRCVDTVYFGDGTFDYATRSNGGSPLCTGCVPCECDNCGELIIDDNGYRVKKNIYVFHHEYPSAGYYRIRTSDPNRNIGVLNMGNSGQEYFYLESILIINSFTGSNSSPVFHADPIDRGCVNKCFTHNPAADDAEGDRLTYRMSTPRGYNGQTVLGYSDPQTGPNGTFNIHPTSGVLTWCAPQQPGEYNIAFVVEEWRRNTSDEWQLIGSVLRDMQVLVRVCPNNDPPLVVVPRDTCVEAGALVSKKIGVSDPVSGGVVTLQGLGGAFDAPDPKATLSNAQAVLNAGNGYKFTADLSWQTSCDHIRLEEYKTTFKATDQSPVVPLATYTVYNIRVVPPAVKNVTAVPVGSYMKISWSLSSCAATQNPLMAYEIYRSEGCVPFVPSPCQTGVPPGGFILIGESDPATSFFMDTNKGEGLVVGKHYSYLVIAVYRDGLQSMGSSVVCAKLKRDVPLLLNVDVTGTSAAAGAIHLRWEKPLTTAGNFDTLAFPGPYQLILKHRSDGAFKTVFNSMHAHFYQLETAFDHKDINTEFSGHEYLIQFISGDDTIGSSSKASSVFLKATPSDRKITLEWQSRTPWDNYRYTIFRKDPLATSFTEIGTSTSASYSDVAGIVNGSAYCYYVKSEGAYSDPAIIKPLWNRSQELCATAVDLTPPATPDLFVEADCRSGRVNVSWKDISGIPGSDDVLKYTLFYKSTVDEPFQEAAVIMKDEPTLYVYDGLTLISGCYAIQATDINNNSSPLSPDFCIDNCPEFELPNVFTPNKDGINDFYKAVKIRQIKEIDLSIVDRWGNVVYTTNDPYFQWDGINIISKQPVSEGTFFYVCDVFEPRLKGITKRNLKGYLQVVR